MSKANSTFIGLVLLIMLAIILSGCKAPGAVSTPNATSGVGLPALGGNATGEASIGATAADLNATAAPSVDAAAAVNATGTFTGGAQGINGNTNNAGAAGNAGGIATAPVGSGQAQAAFQSTLVGVDPCRVLTTADFESVLSVGLQPQANGQGINDANKNASTGGGAGGVGNLSGNGNATASASTGSGGSGGNATLNANTAAGGNGNTGVTNGGNSTTGGNQGQGNINPGAGPQANTASGDGFSCVYTSAGDNTGLTVTATIYPDAYQIKQGQGTSISGLGDAAFTIQDGVYVQVGTRWLLIGINRGSNQQLNTNDAAVSLARLAVPRMR